MNDGGLHLLADLLTAGGVVVLSGAGLSTESGIPDYRGPTGVRRRSAPMTYQEFVSSEPGRQRYWARSHLGWRLIGQARPNDGHRSVAAWQRLGLLGGVITQNVDRLHQAAGATDVVDLHGTLDLVVCLGCGQRSGRAELEGRLHDANPAFAELADRVRQVNPDGDVDLPDELVRSFRVVDCTACGGLLKPDVVFFGENVPKDRVERCYDMVERARSLVVLGSSLTVMSGLRFVRRAAKLGLPVAIVNEGKTRGDECATVKLDVRLGPSLVAVTGMTAQAVGASPAAAAREAGPSAQVVLQELHGA
ncbi:MAG TPA: NAD-dependent protein deacetylase [Actinomycetales bacterium]|nr:NAD-dependent protein deacetylase [Actinomycetales bacterium]